MELELKRIFKGTEYTIGKLYIDGEYFCDTIEDVVRIKDDCSVKIYGKTAIPEGEYDVVMTYWKKHSNWYPLLQKVKCFSGIFIHSGNDEEDSLGCIIVGQNKIKGQVINSKITLDKLRDKLGDEKNISITIK